MYEFSSKEIRKKFKKTEYGKKVNNWLYTSIAVFLSVMILIVFTVCIVYILKNDSLKAVENFIIDWYLVLSSLIFIPIIIMVYFDGKRDGAIEQFKRSSKK